MPRKAKDTAGAKIVTALEETFRKYVAMDPGLPLVLALWSVATHVFECFDAFPYLAITSPTKRCGKTRLAEVIELFCANGLRTVAATPAAIFRTIQAYRLKDGTVTLIIDEAEVLGTRGERAEALREVLNAGYKRGQSVLRCERSDGKEGRYEPKQFETYCPKVIVLIGNLNDTLADRSIPIIMRRKRQGESVARLFLSRVQAPARRLRKQIEQWAKAHGNDVKRRYRGDLNFLEDREAELWLPLFAVCRVAAPKLLEQLQVTALTISRRKESEEPAEVGVMLLKDIRDVFARGGTCDRISTAGLIQALAAIEESPWVTWARGRGLDARGLARILRPFGIQSRNIRFEDGSVVKGYMRDDFGEAWSTYIPGELSATTLQASENVGQA
jgi:hypothetical protein